MVLSILGVVEIFGYFICGVVWVLGVMVVVFEMGGLVLKFVVEVGVVGFDCLFNDWDDVDGVGFRFCLFFCNVLLEVFIK